MAPSSGIADEQIAQLPFSKRDLQIMQLLFQEKCNKEIAVYLGMICLAVEGARQLIQEKIVARNKVGIALCAIRKGIFTIDQIQMS